jgi:nicotinamide-nucleotide adenylyltransferase
MIENGQFTPHAPELIFAYPSLAELRAFTVPQHDTSREANDVDKVSAEYYPQKPLGLVIGRFQPLHYGHIYNWKMALAVSESIVIAIGSAESEGSDNPFSIAARERMVRNALADHNLTHRVSKIVSIKDYDDDGRWFKETLALAGSVDVVVGNNEWVNGIFEEAGLAAVRPPLLERGIYEGKKFRAQLRLQGKLPPI